MITAEDLDYHTPAEADHTWAETSLFPVIVPGAHLYALVYFITRPALGVMTNDIVIYGGLADTRAELLYHDVQQHLPAPERFSDFTSPSGLSFKAVRAPREYRIDYTGFDDTEIHVDWNGLMDPFDIHDPAHSPNASGSAEEREAKSGLGTGFRGHFDMTGRVTGTLKIRGTEYEVDSIDRMDHSWGPRGEMTLPSMNSISATLGEDLAFHVIAHLDLEAPVDRNQTLAHGYVLDSGEVHGIADLDLKTRRAGTMIVAMDMTVTDVRGKSYRLFALPDVGAPWMSYSGGISWNSVMTWVLGDRVGYGVVMEHLPMADLNRRLGRFWTDMPNMYAG